MTKHQLDDMTERTSDLSRILLPSDWAGDTIPIRLVEADDRSYLADLTDSQRAYVTAIGFKPRSGRMALVSDADGALAMVLFGLGCTENADRSPFLPGKLVDMLPPGTYRFSGGHDNAMLAALSFALGAYRFSHYRSDKSAMPACRLVLPVGVDHQEILRILTGVTLTRDLINTPANDMGPAELEAAARELAEAHGGEIETVVGDRLLDANLPLIHAVGRASDREPRLIDLRWGSPDAPKVTVVGKGVCFDTGGLDIKNSAGMALMKKDMGGGAAALGLAAMIMSADLPVRLRVLVPAVENAISGTAFRPGDVLRSRAGITVAIGNTDAEGRLVLADALTLAGEEAPDLLIDLATLTGAARAALGPQLVPFYTGSDELAADIAKVSDAVWDPTWRMPLWRPYEKMLDSKVADIDNAGTVGMAGSITAALFLSRFVRDTSKWIHFDIFGWNPSARPGQPEGGEAQAIRALYEVLKTRYASAG